LQFKEMLVVHVFGLQLQRKMAVEVEF